MQAGGQGLGDRNLWGFFFREALATYKVIWSCGILSAKGGICEMSPAPFPSHTRVVVILLLEAILRCSGKKNYFFVLISCADPQEKKKKHETLIISCFCEIN